MCRAIAAADAEYIYIAEIQLREKIFPLVLFIRSGYRLPAPLPVVNVLLRLLMDGAVWQHAILADSVQLF
jgi:hypothetical protein